MFGLKCIRGAALFAAVFAVANIGLAQCNSGVSTQNAQVAANQQLVLQQTAAIAAQQQAQQIRTVTNSRQVITQPQLPLTLGQSTCTQCQNSTPLAIAPGTARPIANVASTPRPQVAAAPKAATGQPAMMFVRLTPSNSPQRPPSESARYVLMTGSVPADSVRLASR